MTPAEIIKLVGTEFSGMSDEDLAKWLDLSAPLVSKAKFGKLYDQALAYLTCHRMKMAGLGINEDGTVGETLRVTNYSEGNRSIGFAAPQGTLTDAELALTSYGMQFLSIRRSVVISITISGGR